ncbi:MAG: dCTP deaminase domain-containing protein [Syntrophobacteraceae bacterium]
MSWGSLIRFSALRIVLRTEELCRHVNKSLSPPGQFALLLSAEKIKIPSDTIGFISIKEGIKFRGMVNISGFHVAPGFSGRLKFSVYNAGSRPIVLEPGAPTFLLWFASLDRETEDVYKGSHQEQVEITAADVMSLQGDVPSPTALDSRLKEVEAWVSNAKSLDSRLRNVEFWLSVVKSIVVLIVAALLGAIASMLVPRLFSANPGHQSAAISQTSGSAVQHRIERKSPSRSEGKISISSLQSGRTSQ